MIDLLKQLLHLIREPGDLVKAGHAVLMLIIFLETGAMVFFLPGDSLLVTAGLYAAKGDIDAHLLGMTIPGILALNLSLIPMAIIGDAVSYFIGARLGSSLFNRKGSRLFKPEHIQKAQAFYEKHGGKAIIIARFMPIVRTFVPVVAGAAKMPYRRFATYNIVGGAAWVLSMTLIGYGLASAVPDIGKHIEKVIIVVVFLSILPGIIEYWRSRGKAPATPAPPPAA
jgi:membrane-associated protein